MYFWGGSGRSATRGGAGRSPRTPTLRFSGHLHLRVPHSHVAWSRHHVGRDVLPHFPMLSLRPALTSRKCYRPYLGALCGICVVPVLTRDGRQEGTGPRDHLVVHVFLRCGQSLTEDPKIAKSNTCSSLLKRSQGKIVSRGKEHPKWPSKYLSLKMQWADLSFTPLATLVSLFSPKLYLQMYCSSYPWLGERLGAEVNDATVCPLF